jgi:quercetin dioxygenase-like cupin family protein
MTVIDLVTAAADAAPTGLTALPSTPHAARSLLSLPGGSEWEAPRHDLEEQMLLVLEGIASFSVDGWRQSLGPGHLLAIEPGARLGIATDRGERVIALLVVSPAPRGKDSGSPPPASGS